MKRKTTKAILLLCTVLLTLSACTLYLKEQGDAGLVTITIGSGNARAVEWLGPLNPEDLAHTIRVLDRNGEEKHRAENLRYGDKSSFSITPGLYTFHVDAFHNGDLKAAGHTERAIHSGQNPAIIIQMKALPELDGDITIEPSGIVATGTQLTANYSGNESVDFQWNKDGTAIPGANSQSHTPTETGEYTVTVSLAGYNSKTSGTVIVDVVFFSTDNIEAYLTEQSGGNDEYNSISLTISMELSSANWIAILNAIGNSGKYVALNLSACTRSGNASNGGLSSNGTFDPRTTTTAGRDRIVSLTLPEAADSIAAGTPPSNITFNGFTNLRHVNTGNDITSIGGYTFYMIILTSVTIGNSVTSIGISAFYQCQLTSLAIGNNVLSIEQGAFQRNQLTSITIPNSMTSIGTRVFMENQLTSVTIPTSVTNIGLQAFQQNQLTSIIIPNSVTSINGRAFEQNQLISVTIGENVMLGGSGYDAFDNGFDSFYNNNGKQAGTYTYNSVTSTWTKN